MPRRQKRKRRKAKPEEVSEGFKAMTEIVFDGLINGAKFVVGSLSQEAKVRKEEKAAAVNARAEEERKRAVPAWVRA